MTGLSPDYNTAISNSDQANFAVVPADCTVSGLIVGANNYYDAGSDTITLVVYKNTGATTMTCSLTVNNNGASCSDTTHTFSASGGDTLSLAFSETNYLPYVKLTTSLLCN
jgi:hypothetical protein